MPQHPATESAAREALDRGDVEAATVQLVRGYGNEILSFIAGLVSDVATAEDVFSDFCERAFSSLPRFQWRSSLRTWAYTVARNTLRDHMRARRPERRRIAVSSRQLHDVQAEVATRTRPYLKTAIKNRFADLRTRLPETDQVVLLLRVDRELAWTEIAEILADGEQLDGKELSQRVAALRKQFERIKVRLRALAESEGIL